MKTVFLKLALIFFVFPSLLSAGNYSLNLGVNHSWFKYYDDGLDLLKNDFNPGFSLGLMKEYNLKRKLDCNTGIRLFKIGRYQKFDEEFYKGSAKISHYYIGLPIHFNYSLNSSFYSFVNIEPGLQIRSTINTDGDLLNETGTITDEMNRFNLFLGVGLGNTFMLGKRKMGIAASFNHGIFRISKDEEYSDGDNGSRSWLKWKAFEVLINVRYYIK